MPASHSTVNLSDTFGVSRENYHLFFKRWQNNLVTICGFKHQLVKPDQQKCCDLFQPNTGSMALTGVTTVFMWFLYSEEIVM